MVKKDILVKYLQATLRLTYPPIYLYIPTYLSTYIQEVTSGGMVKKDILVKYLQATFRLTYLSIYLYIPIYLYTGGDLGGYGQERYLGQVSTSYL